jgi:hypothetical protein
MEKTDMTQRYRKFKRAWGMWYAFDNSTGNSESLKTKDKAEANRLIVAMNEAGQQAAMNLSLARVYLRHTDPSVSARTWQTVLDEISRRLRKVSTAWKIPRVQSVAIFRRLRAGFEYDEVLVGLFVFAFFTPVITPPLLLAGSTPIRDLGARSKTAPASPS